MARRAAVLLLLAFATVGFAARVPSFDRLVGSLESRNSANSLKAIQWLLERKGKGGPAYMAIKYEVPCDLHDKFMKEWERVGDYLTKDAKGLDFFQHTKTLSDNTDFWTYQEWDSFDDLMDMYEADEIKDFFDFVDDNDILMEVFPLEGCGDEKREYRADRSGEGPARAARAASDAAVERRNKGKGKGGRSETIEDFDPRDSPAHIAIHFHIPPSRTTEFVKSFEDIQDRVVDKEDENRFYVLRKFATLNHHYMMRAGWDTLDAWLDHATSKTFRELRDFTMDNDVEWHSVPFHVIDSSEKEDM